MLNKATALFGGSFNPPTKAHLSVIEGVARRFERVIVIPAAISPFKQGAEVLDGADRVRLLTEMTAHLDNVTVSPYELDKAGVSYTYLTLQHFSKIYGELYFVLGTDNVVELDRWKNLDEISRLATLYFVPRPYYDYHEDKKILSRLGVRYQIADFCGEDGSSSLVAVAAAFDKLGEVLPACVKELVEEKNAYNGYKYITDIFPEVGMKMSRSEHIYRTAKAALILAKKNGVPADKAIRAALMHDLGKYVTTDMLAVRGVTLCPEAYEVAEQIRHCYTGEYLAGAKLGECDSDVLNAIKYHTTGRKNMSMLEKVIFCADYIEEGRSFDGLDEIRAITYHDINKGMIKIIENTLCYLKSRDMAVEPKTIECYEWLKKGE